MNEHDDRGTDFKASAPPAPARSKRLSLVRETLTISTGISAGEPNRHPKHCREHTMCTK